MNTNICILTQSHLCRNPRVVKEANSLAKAGYKVSILTTFAFENLLEEDKTLIDTSKINYKGVVNLIPGGNSKWNIFKAKMVKRIAAEMVRIFKIQTPFALGYDFLKNYRAAKKANADLYICHQEASTVIGYKLLKKGKKVAFDFEDWYSHDLLPSANKYRPLQLLEKVENYALKNASLVYSTSQSMATAMAKVAGSKIPKVLNNVFPLVERETIDNFQKDREDLKKASIHWYSQTIGPGRGLEFLTAALNKVETPVELHLRGNYSNDYKNELLQIFPSEKGHKLFFHNLVTHHELISRIAEHDIGLALEENKPDSRNLTITNKILQYLLAGIAVIASDTEGQKEVGQYANKAISTFRNKNIDELSFKITTLVSNKAALKEAKDQALKVAKEYYSWEKQESLLLKWIKETMEN